MDDADPWADILAGAGAERPSALERMIRDAADKAVRKQIPQDQLDALERLVDLQGDAHEAGRKALFWARVASVAAVLALLVGVLALLIG